MSVYVHVDTSDVDHELRRLEAGPGRDDLLALYMVLFQNFQITQADVHVITSSLRRSGTVDADYDYLEWTGEITYGGESRGSVHDPVKYAVYEQNKGDYVHDFMRGVYGGDSGYSEAIIDFYRGTHL